MNPAGGGWGEGESAVSKKSRGRTHLANDALVRVVQPPADALNVRASVKDLHRVVVELVEDCLLAHADLEVYREEVQSAAKEGKEKRLERTAKNDADEPLHLARRHCLEALLEKAAMNSPGRRWESVRGGGDKKRGRNPRETNLQLSWSGLATSGVTELV